MSDDWIKMRTALRRHPKTVRIMSALQADRLRVIGGMYAVWSVFDEQSADGTLPGYTFAIMDIEIGWPGFSDGLGAVGWLAETAVGLVIPRSEEHNGKSAKRRAQDADRKKSVRSLSASDADVLRTRVEKEKEKEVKKKAPVVPKGDAAEAVIDAYHEMLPKCRRCEVLTPKLRKKIEKISALAVFSMKRHGLEYDPAEFWSAYFGECQSDPWKSGEKRNPNNPSWRQHIGCLIDDERFQDIMDNAIGRMREAGELP